MENVDAGVARIRADIERIKKENGIDRDITLLAATKTVPAEIINYATHTLGITDIGENRVQELLSKYDDLEKDGVNIHFIGKLQSNKVKYIIDKVCMIHSLDSEKLAAEIDKQSAKIGKVTDVLVEINIGREPNKSGIMPEDAESFIDSVMKYKNIRVVGLMTIAPVCEDKEEYKKYFSETYRIFIDISQKKLDNIKKPILSMGMSGSYEPAICCGSNMVRIGTALFGRRHYPEKENSENNNN